MSKKVTRLNRAKIYNPHNADPLYATNVITCNKTTQDGNVENLIEHNAEEAREWVDENQK